MVKKSRTPAPAPAQPSPLMQTLQAAQSLVQEMQAAQSDEVDAIPITMLTQALHVVEARQRLPPGLTIPRWQRLAAKLILLAHFREHGMALHMHIVVQAF